MIRLPLLLAVLGGAALALTSMDAAQRAALLAWIGIHWIGIVPWLLVAILWLRLRTARGRAWLYEEMAAGAIEDVAELRAQLGTARRRPRPRQPRRA